MLVIAPTQHQPGWLARGAIVLHDTDVIWSHGRHTNNQQVSVLTSVAHSLHRPQHAARRRTGTAPPVFGARG